MSISLVILMENSSVVVCKECRHVAKDQDRHKQHIREARHIHAFRNLAYRYSKH